MMKNRSLKVLCIVLCATMVIPSIACGKKNDNGSHTNREVAAVNEEDTSADVVEEYKYKEPEETRKMAGKEELKRTEAEERKKVEEEDRKKAAEEEERKKAAEEEERKKAAEEEERKKAAEEEERKKVEEEELKKAEEERKKAEEEERKKAEEERKKVEEEEQRKAAAEAAAAKAEEERKHQIELNSFSMMYYLAITAEDILQSKNNRVMLDDIYSALLNDINPGAVDEITQDHLKNLRDIIKSYINISTKRDRLQYLYNQKKAAAIRNAVPNPLAILSVTNSLDWKKLAVSVVYTAVDSFTSYKNASDSADQEFLVSGWELDDEELATVQRNRDRAFDYMVDMVQEYRLDGMMTLNEEAINNFAEICNTPDAPERIKLLVAEEETYKLLGNYWLELADSYFEVSKYDKCLECVNNYDALYTGIYRKDINYVSILPKAIAAAENVYSNDKTKCVQVIKKYAEAIEKNTSKTSTKDWSSHYFVAQVYLDLYSKTNDKTFLRKAYDIASNNVAVLLKEQRKMNETYLAPVVEEEAKEPDYTYLNEQEKKEEKKKYEEEKKRVKEYNKAINEARETELPGLYQPLILNCELLFAISDQISLSDSEKTDVDAILKSKTCGTFIVKPINDEYSFGNVSNNYTVGFSKEKITIPVEYLTSESKISVIVNEPGRSQTFTDCVIDEVERNGNTIDTFKAYVSSKQLKKYEWTSNSKIIIRITYGDAYDKTIDFNCSVVEFEEHWYGDKVVFG